ncbi:MAG: HNH endonuclease signature motif containing protein [Gammaproteobacteria bacterium]|nr:HNH endonuclease signature motif containing protein [Gammaproteobacteria bacterium]
MPVSAGALCALDVGSEFAASFWGRTELGAKGCLEWQGAKSNGYGMVVVPGERQQMAHRVAFRLAGNELPAGTVLRHLCHNRLCVTPGHLAVGSPADNARDNLTSGMPAGGCSKLSLAMARDIRTMASMVPEAGMRFRELMAEHYGVHDRTVYDVLRQHVYREVA